MTGSSEAVAQEILVVDADERVRRGLERLFVEAGVAVTALGDVDRARDQLSNRFFAVALFDLDTPQPDGGLELVRFCKEKAPLTAPLVMTTRRSFESASAAFRAGAVDVFPKSQDAVPYLRDRVLALASEIKASVDRDRLLDEVSELHEWFLEEMMALSRRAIELEDRLLAREGSSSPSIGGTHRLTVLLVDDDSALQQALDRHLTHEKGWALRAAQTGGEALDMATQLVPNVVVVKETLPDLPSTMVIKSLKTTFPDAVAVVFTPPSRGRVGEVRMVEQSKLVTLVPSFTEPAQLVASLEEIREALKQKSRERRYLKVFRQQHLDFLKRYNSVRGKLERRSGRRG